MRAHDLVEDYPRLDVSAPADTAARLIGSERRPALLVLDGQRVVTVLPASQVVALLIPPYLREDPSLVRVYDERTADACAQRLIGKTVGDLLPRQGRTEVPVVDSDATVLECASAMAAAHSPLLVVTGPLPEAGRDKPGREVVLGVITASKLLDTLLP